MIGIKRKDRTMEIIVHEDWVSKVNDELNQIKDSSSAEMEQHWNKRSIYQLPVSVTELNERAYKPRVVSFGPYHHGQPHLRPMEEHKHRAFLLFLKRSNKPLEVYMKSLAPLMQDLKKSYDSLDKTWEEDTDAFMKLMIVDGCFMLEILRLNSSTADFPHPNTQNGTSFANLKNDNDGAVHDYAPNDPIFSNHGKIQTVQDIKRDMLLLENQLPLLLLHNLLTVQYDKLMHEEFLNLRIQDLYFPNEIVSKVGECLHVLDVFRKNLILKNFTPTAPLADECLHVLDVFRKKLILTKFTPTSGPAPLADENGSLIIWSATKLREAGIRFQISKSSSLKDITFDIDGVLRLPVIVVDDFTEYVLRNLIAFEKFHVGSGNEVTSYIWFIDSIINDERDVSLLNSKGIILYVTGSDKATAQLFNSIVKETGIVPSLDLATVCRRVNQYCKKPWNKWRANLWHTYFRSPWAVISILAAICLFAVTITQTIYTVLQYYQHDPIPPSPVS